MKQSQPHIDRGNILGVNAYDTRNKTLFFYGNILNKECNKEGFRIGTLFTLNIAVNSNGCSDLMLETVGNDGGWLHCTLLLLYFLFFSAKFINQVTSSTDPVVIISFLFSRRNSLQFL